MIKVEKDLTNVPLSLLANPPKIDNEVRHRLENDFNQKCCYCEDSQIKGEVEHFLPKSKVAHLEFEWKNLLWACHDCNNLKSDKYNIGKPIINPTEEDPEPMLIFDLKGNIKHKNQKADETIDTCKLNRKNLIDKRKLVIDEFLRNLEFVYKNGNKDVVLKYIEIFFKSPITNNNKLSFIALRRYIIENYLGQILKLFECITN